MTTNVNAAADSSQVETGGKNEPPPPPAPPSPVLHGGSKVYKTGPLFLSSKGIGWTSWKKRWFILTQTSLVFYRSDPNVAPQKGGEVNLTLGGIDLNSSGSVVVKEDKKLLTVLFTDGRDGRAFTLKAETLEDLHEWKVALEEALSNAPNAASLVGQNGVLKNDQTSSANTTSEQLKDRQTAKSLVIGRPILLALEDIDGTPSFLEKALRFLEDYGVKTEGILRQAADVEDVERRIQEYEKGKTDFSPDEDSHVIADCVKYVLRELPSSPVPASCCKALLEACRTERSMRLNAMRSAICETFPEPNRRLLQRILDMMQTVALNKTVNRMSISAVAACMAPLLLRPLLAGDCDLDNDFDMAGDGSIQLMQAAAAANHAQAIVITLLEEYDKIFGDGAVTHEPYTDSEESGSESEEITEDDDSFDEDDVTDESESEVDEDFDHESSPTSTETSDIQANNKVSEGPLSNTPQVEGVPESSKNLSSGPPQTSSLQKDSVQGSDTVKNLDEPKTQSNPSPEVLGADSVETSAIPKPSEKLYGHFRSARRPNILGRTPAKKNLSMESIDIHFEDEAEIQKLEGTRTDSETTTPDEASASSVLQDCLKKQKNHLHERLLSLEKDVASLQEQIQKEMDLRTALEVGLKVSKLPHSVTSLDDKMKAELAEIALAEADVMNLKQKADDLEFQLIQQRDQNSRIGQDIGNQIRQNPNNQFNSKEKQVDGGVLAAPSPSENVSRSKHESSLDKPEGEKDKKQESASSPHKPLPLNQQTEAALNHKSLTRKSSKGEGSNSALSKLTNRLNFLKERRSQNASDSQTLDKGRNSDENSDKHQDSKGQSSKHQDSKGQSSEMDNNESRHSANGQLQQNVDNKGKSEGHQRGKSGGHSPVEKGHSKFPPRTFSR